MPGLITGGARGLGEAVAARLVRDGSDVAIMDVAESVFETAERLRSIRAGADVIGILGDVSDEAEAERAVSETVRRLGGLDLLVNNAGIGGPGSVLVDTSAEDIRRVLDVNLLGAFLMSRAAAREMVARRSGCIVNIGSIFGQQGCAGDTAYCASKGGIALLTQALSLELAPLGVRVNTVAPGNMATEMHWDHLRDRARTAGTSFEEELERVRSSVPLGRLGTGDDVAGAVAWLASGDASYVTGQTIGVNGGVFLS
jgi:NAD(P)-dependent dehydrogenase (short-subunit alcohol dehydrogenase family)